MAKQILVFAGSTRKGSFSKAFAGAAARAIDEAGGVAQLIDLGDFPATIYNQDEEAANGLPETMQRLKAAIAGSDGLMVSTPEYNGCVPPLLINVLSWVSRPEGDEAASAVFAGKPVAVMACSPGGMGGVRVIPRLRDFLCELGCVPVSGFASLAQAHEAFDDQGNLVSEQVAGMVEGLAGRLVGAS